MTLVVLSVERVNPCTAEAVYIRFQASFNANEMALKLTLSVRGPSSDVRIF